VPQHEKSWETGAAGEEALAASLKKRCPSVLVLHDRRLGDGRANIDHLAVAPSGVYVIDAKRLRGRIEVRKPFFGEEKLAVAGRDKTKLVESLERQVDAVRSGLELIEQDVPVYGCFCFVDSDGGIPLLRTLKIKDFALMHPRPRRLAKRLNRLTSSFHGAGPLMPPAGLEPATRGLKGHRSNQLSYRGR
jgi:hypothetical protein